MPNELSFRKCITDTLDAREGDALRGGNIILGHHAQYRAILIGVASRLHQAFDARTHLLCNTPQVLDYYRKRTDCRFLASIEMGQPLYAACRTLIEDPEAVYAEARRNEQELGITYNELAITDRHLGRGYALGGFGHPRTRMSEETSYTQMVHAYNVAIRFWLDKISTYSPHLMINCGKVAATIARAHSIPYRTLSRSRYRNYHYWAFNEFFESPGIEDAYWKEEPSERLELETPYDAHLSRRSIQQQETHPLRLVKRMSTYTARHVYGKLRGYEKARSNYLSEILPYFIRRFRDMRRMSCRSLISLEDIKTHKFVYFPLHTEPEIALQGLSPEYFYQLACIAALSRDLPAGVLLVVKESYPAVGRRPAQFYDQINEFKNVRMMRIDELGIEVARASQAVATITGTGGFEAAAMGKPVITFGRHNIYNFLPHVRVIEDETHLRFHLHDVLSPDFDDAEAARNGQHFLNAMVRCSFDLGKFLPTAPSNAAGEALDAATAALLASLRDANPRSQATPAMSAGPATS